MRYPLDKNLTTQEFWNDIINGKPYYSRLFKMKWHDWQDFSARTPQPIYAVCDWIVKVHSESEWRPYGNYIDLIGQWYLFRYAHLSSMSVKTLQNVKEWEIIGYTGNSGKSGWPHLHFWCYKVDEKWNILNKSNWYFGAINPIPILNQKISMTDFKKILKDEFPDMVDVVKDYEDSNPLTVWNAKALIVLITSRILKKHKIIP